MARTSTTDLVRLYLQDIGRVSLLDQEEELTLARPGSRSGSACCSCR